MDGRIARDLDLALLRTFLTVAATRSVTAAGQRLFRTQPAISQRLRRLEEAVGSPLLARSPEGMLLTPEGEVVLRYARKMLALNDDMLAEAGRAARQVVRLAVAEELKWLPISHMLQGCMECLPQALIHFEYLPSNILIQRGFRGDFDIALAVSLEPPGDRWIAVSHIHLTWTGHPRPNKNNNHILPLIMFSDGNLYRDIALSYLRSAGLDWEIVFESPHWEAISNAVQAGLGLSIMPTKTTMKDLSEFSSSPLPSLPRLHSWVICTRPATSQALEVVALQLAGLMA